MKKRGVLAVFLASIIIAMCIYFDNYIIKLISLIQTGILNKIFLAITYISSEIIIFFALTILFLWKDDKRRWIAPLWLTLGLSAAISFLLKISIQRNRPFQLGLISTLQILEQKSFLTWNFSFPSFQAMLVFCALPIIIRGFPKLKHLWILFAGLVGFSRVYFGLHFLSDVVAGGLIGYFIGMFIVNKELENKFGERIAGRIFKKKKFKYKERKK